MNKCEKCGFLHYRTDPCREPRNTRAKVDMVRPISAALAPAAVRDSQEQRKSTAVRKDVPRLAEDRTATASGAPTKQRAKYEVEAGTQALPVDTGAPPMAGGGNLKRHTAEFDPQGAPAKFNKTAYQREYVAKWRRGEVGNKYRSKAKEDKQNG